MTTGVELAIGKASLSAVSRSLGSPIKIIKARGVAKRTKRALEGGSLVVGTSELIRNLDVETAGNIERFIASPEVANISYCISTIMLLGKCGKKTDKQITDLKSQLRESARLALDIPDGQIDVVSEFLFSDITKAIVDQIDKTLIAGEEIPSEMKASLIKAIPSYESAFEKNTAFLQRITGLAEFRDFETELRRQIKNLHGTMRLPHTGTTRQVPYAELYVQPMVSMYSDAVSASDRVSLNTAIPVDVLLENSLRVALLGDPGGGKSTLSLKLAYDVACGNLETMGPTIPFLIVLREYAVEYQKTRMPLTDYIKSVCENPYAVSPPKDSIEYFLANGRALVIFDGLDELLDISLRQSIVDAVTGFTYRFPTTPILVTSRRVGYEDAPLNPSLFDVASLQEFQEEQVFEYVNKWFSLDISLTSPRRKQLATGFKTDSQFVADLRVNPLMLSLMCGIYSTENYIPSNRPDVYEKCALLLFERWDKQRGINAALSFDAHVQAAMRSLALWLYPQQASHQGLSRSKLVEFMKNYLREKRFDNDEDAEVAATQFIDFCKGRAWVLTDVGAELYGFTHRTFLEYFAASQLVRLYPDPQLLYDHLEEHIIGGGWTVVVQLAIQILNKTVEDGGDNFLDLILTRSLGSDGRIDNSRVLAVAAEAISYIVPKAEIIERVVDACIEYWCAPDTGASESGGVSRFATMSALLGASRENQPRIAKSIYNNLAMRLSGVDKDIDALGLALNLDFVSGVAGRATSRSRGERVYWAGVRQSNEARFNEAAVARADIPWIGCYLLKAGQITASELIDTYGPSVILNDSRYSDSLGLTMLHQMALSASNHTIGIMHDDHDIPVQHVVAIFERLTEQPTPWFEYEIFADIDSQVVLQYCVRLYSERNMRFETRDDDGKILGALVTCLAILTEYDGLTRGEVRRGPVYYPIRESRYGGDETSDLNVRRLISAALGWRSRDQETPRMAALEQLNISSPFQANMAKWILGDLRFWHPLRKDLV